MKKWAGFIFIILITGYLQSFSQTDGQGRKSLPVRSEDFLDSRLSGTSTLFFWNGDLWTSNDHGDMEIFSLDTLNGTTKDSVKGCLHFHDMEEMTQDDEYFYFGDFGNNHSVLRNDLCIYRMAKADMLGGVCRADTIRFTYEGYNPDGEGSSGTPVTDFDCEAMVAVGDSRVVQAECERAGDRCKLFPPFDRYKQEAMHAGAVRLQYAGAALHLFGLRLPRHPFS